MSTGEEKESLSCWSPISLFLPQTQLHRPRNLVDWPFNFTVGIVRQIVELWQSLYHLYSQHICACLKTALLLKSIALYFQSQCKLAISQQKFGESSHSFQRACEAFFLEKMALSATVYYI